MDQSYREEEYGFAYDAKLELGRFIDSPSWPLVLLLAAAFIVGGALGCAVFSLLALLVTIMND